MKASLRTLVADILDYAGLFPPAELSLDAAIRNYARYRNREEAWMLARFVCPARRLGELAPYVDELFDTGPALRLCILGRGGGTRSQFLEGMRCDLQDMKKFHARHAARTGFEVFEVRLPEGVADKSDVSGLLQAVGQVWRAHDMARVPIFCEPATNVDSQSVWPTLIEGMARHSDETGCLFGEHSSDTRVGFKLRCGGKDASAFPSVEQVAAVIGWACAGGVPLKFTAGLHQPLRHHDEKPGVKVHGFLNVFAAGILAASGKATHEEVCGILAAEAIDDFEFTADGLSFKGLRVTSDQIATARRGVVTSFGSCSFDEPLDGLRELGLL